MTGIHLERDQALNHYRKQMRRLGYTEASVELLATGYRDGWNTLSTSLARLDDAVRQPPTPAEPVEPEA